MHLLPKDGIGGVESAARSMLEGQPLDCEFKLQFIKQGDGPSENNPLAHFRALGKIHRFEPDVLVCSLWRTAPIGLIYKFLNQKSKLILFLHSPSDVHFLDAMCRKLMMTVCDAVWADSNATLGERGGMSKKIPRRAISFVTISRINQRPPSQPAPRFVFWGRLHQQKGLDRSIELIRALIDHGISARYEVWGPDGGAASVLREQIRHSGLGEEVVLKGPANHGDLDRIAHDSSFYLQLSRQEGMAMSVVEAMQRGLVPVVAPVGEIGTYCRDGENAIIVHDPDNVSDAVQDVQRLLLDSERYRRMQDSAFRHWLSKPLYREDFCSAVKELMQHKLRG